MPHPRRPDHRRPVVHVPVPGTSLEVPSDDDIRRQLEAVRVPVSADTPGSAFPPRGSEDYHAALEGVLADGHLDQVGVRLKMLGERYGWRVHIDLMDYWLRAIDNATAPGRRTRLSGRYRELGGAVDIARFTPSNGLSPAVALEPAARLSHADPENRGGTVEERFAYYFDDAVHTQAGPHRWMTTFSETCRAIAPEPGNTMVTRAILANGPDARVTNHPATVGAAMYLALITGHMTNAHIRMTPPPTNRRDRRPGAPRT